MKKNSLLGLISAIALLATTQTKAQEKQTFYVGYGLGTHEEFGDFFTGISSYMASLGTYSLMNDHYSGAFFTGYRRALSKRFEIGGMVSYEKMKGNLQVMEDSYAVRNDHYAFMGEVRYHFIVKPKFQLFSGAAAGLSVHSIKIDDIMKKRENELEEAFHVDLIGISIGNTISPYIALGYGYKGMVNLGLAASF